MQEQAFSCGPCLPRATRATWDKANTQQVHELGLWDFSGLAERKTRPGIFIHQRAKGEERLGWRLLPLTGSV